MSEGFGGEYDSVVRWDRRLAREAPFFERLFAEHGVTSLADVGCGTGRHAVLFASWTIEVWALDPSEEMLEQAREHAYEAGANVHFALAGFGEVERTVGEVDAIVSLGNALPHVGDVDALRVAFADMAAALRPGAPLVLHLLNHDRIEREQLRLLPSVLRSGEKGETVVAKVIDHAEDHYVIEFVRLMRPHRSPEMLEDEASSWTVDSRRSRHAKLLGETIRGELQAAGFTDIEALGDHSGRPLDVARDESAIWVAVRG
jgi:SAM-dependent methyltransferase